MINGLQIDNAGDKRYYKNSKLHRIGSPAIELASGTKIWYYEDKRIFCNSQEEFEKLLKLKAFW